MSASVIRPVVNQWLDSHDALDIAEGIWKTGDKIKDHGSALLDHPHDMAIRAAARAEARRVIALCDRLEAISR